jgi:8-amino-7-oxononanoate synthase
MFAPLDHRIATRLDFHCQAQQRRDRAAVQAVVLQFLHSDAEPLINFASNDYLGLAQSSDLKKSIHIALGHYGLGAKSSQVVAGFTQLQHEFEKELANFLGFEKLIFFNSGYIANFSLLSTLLEKNDHVYCDRMTHASFYDAILSTQCSLFRYQHLQTSHLKKLLQANMDASKTAFIVTDGLFSMEGDRAPLVNLIKIAEKYQASLIVDDAHGIGVLGEYGKGIIEQTAKRSFILTGTLSKAFGSFGGFIAGKAELIELLIQQSRAIRYTNNLPAILYAAGKTALELIQKETWRREKLNHLSLYFQKISQELDLPVLCSTTPIQSIIISNIKKLLWIGEQLKKNGFWVGVIRPPSVSPKQARLRITLSSLHEEKDVYNLLLMIKKLCREYQ